MSRHLAVPGTRNARDLGGLPAADGRAVRPGLVLRSDSLAGLPDEGVAALAALRIEAVVDLRDRTEVEFGGADRLPAGARLLAYEVLGRRDIAGVGTDPESIVEVFAAGGAAHVMRETYAFMATAEHARQAWGELLRMLAAPSTGAVLVHCVAGKDRTGWFAALLLRALAVEEDALRADYLASNAAFDPTVTGVLPQGLDRLVDRLGDLELVLPLVRVEESYLDAGFAAADAAYGDFATYLRLGLGIDAATVAALRERLLT